MDQEEKQRLKRKLLKRFNDGKREHCVICGQTIAGYDIQDGKFEYTKSVRGEHLAHSYCVKKMIKRKK